MHNKYIIQRFLVSATTDLHIFYSKLNEEISFKIRFFSAKKKKKKRIKFRNRGLVVPSNNFQISFLGEAAERSSGRVGLSFPEASSFYAPSQPPTTRAAASPTLGPVSSPSCSPRTKAPLVGGWSEEKTETHWHRFRATSFFLRLKNIIKRGKRGGNRLRSSSECRALVMPRTDDEPILSIYLCSEIPESILTVSQQVVNRV